MKSKVYPTREASLVLRHPIDGPLSAAGSDWEVDGFTCRMLVDNMLTSDADQAWKAPAPVEPQQSAPVSDDHAEHE